MKSGVFGDVEKWSTLQVIIANLLYLPQFLNQDTNAGRIFHCPLSSCQPNAFCGTEMSMLKIRWTTFWKKKKALSLNICHILFIQIYRQVLPCLLVLESSLRARNNSFSSVHYYSVMLCLVSYYLHSSRMRKKSFGDTDCHSFCQFASIQASLSAQLLLQIDIGHLK